MRRRSRTRRVLKWVGTTLATLTLIGALVNLHWDIRVFRSKFGFGVSGGSIFVNLVADPSLTYTPGWSITAHEIPALAYRAIRYFSWGPAAAGRIRHGRAPTWAIFLLFAIPTGLLWYLDPRRVPPGHCEHCGYDLTGNVSGRCPECGEPVSAE